MLHPRAVLVILERCIPNPGGRLYEVLCSADACATGCKASHLGEPETDLGCPGSAPPCMTTQCDPSRQCAVPSLHVEGHTCNATAGVIVRRARFGLFRSEVVSGLQYSDEQDRGSKALPDIAGISTRDAEHMLSVDEERS